MHFMAQLRLHGFVQVNCGAFVTFCDSLVYMAERVARHSATESPQTHYICLNFCAYTMIVLARLATVLNTHLAKN